MAVVYRNLVYLDTEKTGSTYVQRVLNQALGEAPLSFDMHQPVAEHDPTVPHLITVRNPFDQYMSLYRYGATGQGAVRRRIEMKGFGSVYNGFDDWLDFVLNPENAGLIDPTWKKSNTYPFLGLMSYRFVRLSVAHPSTLLPSLKRVQGVLRVYRAHRIWNTLLRNETLSTDLENYLDRERDRLGVVLTRDELHVAANPRVRVNSSGGSYDTRLFDRVAARAHDIARRESVICDEFGYHGPSPLPAPTPSLVGATVGRLTAPFRSSSPE